MAGPPKLSLASGGILKLPPALLKQLRATVGTVFLPVAVGGSLLFLFKEDDEGRLARWAPHCTLAGRIGSFGIADLFSALNMGQKTGVLVFEADEIHKEVYFERGEIVFATSNQPEHRLGNILVQKGLLRREQVEAVARKLGGARLGAKLVQSGLLGAKELYDAVRQQVEEILYSIFPMEAGSFYFFEGSFLPEDLAQFTLNTQNILMEGYRRLDEWGLIRERIPHPDVVVVKKEGARPAKFDDPFTEQLYDRLPARTTIRELVRRTGADRFEVNRAVYELLRRGAVEVVDPRAAPRPDTLEGLVQAYNRLYVAAVRTLAKVGKADEVLQQVTVELDERARQLFEGVRFDAQAGLAQGVERLMRNLDRLVQGAGAVRIAGLDTLFKKQMLQGVLDEVLNFLLFALKNTLPPEQADPLIQKIRNAHKRLRREQ